MIVDKTSTTIITPLRGFTKLRSVAILGAIKFSLIYEAL